MTERSSNICCHVASYLQDKSGNDYEISRDRYEIHVQIAMLQGDPGD